MSNPFGIGERFTLRHIRVDKGGYINRGRHYYGASDQKLYWWSSPDDAHSDYVRASDRADAKAKVRIMFPHARFYGK